VLSGAGWGQIHFRELGRHRVFVESVSLGGDVGIYTRFPYGHVGIGFLTEMVGFRRTFDKEILPQQGVANIAAGFTSWVGFQKRRVDINLGFNGCALPMQLDSLPKAPFYYEVLISTGYRF
jgi:hypothetical protein